MSWDENEGLLTDPPSSNLAQARNVISWTQITKPAQAQMRQDFERLRSLITEMKLRSNTGPYGKSWKLDHPADRPLRAFLAKFLKDFTEWQRTASRGSDDFLLNWLTMNGNLVKDIERKFPKRQERFASRRPEMAFEGWTFVKQAGTERTAAVDKVPLFPKFEVKWKARDIEKLVAKHYPNIVPGSLKIEPKVKGGVIGGRAEFYCNFDADDPSVPEYPHKGGSIIMALEPSPQGVRAYAYIRIDG